MPKWESEKITVGDFIFTARYKGGVIDSKQKEDLERYAVQLMERHYRFYGSLRARESEFVTEDSIVYCTNGFHTTRFGVMKDHGVYREDMKPIMTCKDCASGDNIYSFGICRCPESTFNNTYPRPVDTLEYIDNRDSNGEQFGLAFVPVTGPRCIPMLNGYWKQGECSTMIWDGTIEDYVPALLDNAYQVCFYGGVITILGTPAQGINTNPGWLQLSNGKWMYVTQEGKAVVSDWLTIEGKKYHFDPVGYMDTGLVWIKDNYYYFHPEGHLASSEWIEDSDEKYWVNKDGIWDGSYPDPEDELRDKIIEAAIWYKDGCDQNIHIKYSMNKRGTDPGGTRHKLFKPWQAYEYLDCSGYVGAVYTTAGIPDFDANDPMDCLNTDKLRANSRTYKISKEDLLPGDLVFKNGKSAGGENHVGIFAYFDTSGSIVAYDCGTANGIQLRKIPNYWETNSSLYYRYIGFEK